MANLTGQKINMLLVLQRFAETKDKPYVTYLCLCDCGNQKIIARSNLTSGKTKSCGCLHDTFATKHGHYNSPTYQTWKALKQRTQNPKASNWRWYGAKGVKLSVRWLKFENFLEDMGERPEGKTLDRNNPYKHYIKSNCKWSTSTEQNNNKRNSEQWQPFETNITF